MKTHYKIMLIAFCLTLLSLHSKATPEEADLQLSSYTPTLLKLNEKLNQAKDENQATIAQKAITHYWQEALDSAYKIHLDQYENHPKLQNTSKEAQAAWEKYKQLALDTIPEESSINTLQKENTLAELNRTRACLLLNFTETIPQFDTILPSPSGTLIFVKHLKPDGKGADAWIVLKHAYTLPSTDGLEPLYTSAQNDFHALWSPDAHYLVINDTNKKQNKNVIIYAQADGENFDKHSDLRQDYMAMLSAKAPQNPHFTAIAWLTKDTLLIEISEDTKSPDTGAKKHYSIYNATSKSFSPINLQ